MWVWESGPKIDSSTGIRGIFCDFPCSSLDPQVAAFRTSASCEEEEACVFHDSITILYGKPETIC